MYIILTDLKHFVKCSLNKKVFYKFKFWNVTTSGMDSSSEFQIIGATREPDDPQPYIF